jgi:23S rRNA (uracil1939-C5)-methyltransferase
MKKGQIAEGNVTTVEFPNKGIVMTDEGERVIVKNTIPGQRVSFAVNKVRKGKAEGRLLETVKKSPRETADTCRHFGQCGGCTYQSLPYEEQLKIKEKQVRGMMEQAIGDACAYEFLPIRHSPRVLAYRNKMEFSFGDEYKDGPLALGMHKRGSFYDIVTVEDCRIVDGDFRAILMATLIYFREQEISFYHRLRHTGYLRHLLVRKAVKTGEILVDLISTTQDWRNVQEQEQEPDERAKIAAALLEKQGRCPHAGTVNEEKEKQLLAGWKDVLLALSLEGTLKGVLHTKNDSVADVVKNEGTEVLFGQDYFYEELLGLRFQISPFSFFQTNSLGAEVLYSTAREFILGDNPDMLADKTVYDLYSGTGTIAQMLAPVCKKVVGVEIIEEAVEAAKENAALNHLDNCEFLAGDVLKVLDTIEERPDYIVLDPPRDGIHPKALEKIINYGVDHMIYISCKPTSLARDLEVLLARGYVVDKVQCVDMFPNTVHVETVVLLSQLKQKPDDYINVTIELDDMDITSAETKATYDEIKEYVFEHNAGMKVSNLYISQVKRKCGIEVGKNYNLPKNEDSRQPQCPEDKERAIVEALKHFKMIQQK